MYYQKAIDIIASRRRHAESSAYERYRLALTDDGFYEIEKRLKDAELSTLKKIKTNENIEKLKKKRVEALKRLKLTESDFTPKYKCPLCDDIGMLKKTLCKCAKNLCIEIAQESTSAYIKEATFDAVKFEIFKEERAKMERIYGLMRQFSDKFPNTKYRNLLLLGSVGTGKTFLISCMANYLISKGENVFPVTAFELLNRSLNYHTASVGNKMHYLVPLLESDLLIIDDLGTESIFKNVTIEYLYLILNERLVKGKHTIITTNLDLPALEARYGTRISSRLLDKTSTFVAALSGSDVRKLL